jgi:hypothetical protein
MKLYWGENLQLHVLLTSALVEDEWSASYSGRFTPEEKAPVIEYEAGWAREPV